MSSTLTDWPALAGTDISSCTVALGRAIYGKAHLQRTDYRWLVASPSIRAALSSLEGSFTLGPFERGERAVHWRALDDGRYLAVGCRPSKSRDHANRRTLLELDLLFWRANDELPVAVAAAGMLPHALGLGDEVWWSKKSDRRWSDGDFVLDIEDDQLSIEAEGIAALFDEGLAWWAQHRGTEHEAFLERAYASVISGDAPPVVLAGLSEPLPPAAIAASLLPLSPAVIERCSIASWLFSERVSRRDLEGRWDWVACKEPSNDLALLKGPVFSDRIFAQAQSMAQALLHGEPSRIQEAVLAVSTAPKPGAPVLDEGERALEALWAERPDGRPETEEGQLTALLALPEETIKANIDALTAAYSSFEGRLLDKIAARMQRPDDAQAQILLRRYLPKSWLTRGRCDEVVARVVPAKREDPHQRLVEAIADPKTRWAEVEDQVQSQPPEIRSLVKACFEDPGIFDPDARLVGYRFASVPAESQAQPSALLLACLRRVMSQAPEDLEDSESHLLADCIRAAALVIVPSPDTIERFGLPTTGYIPALFFAPLLYETSVQALDALGEGQDRALGHSLDCKNATYRGRVERWWEQQNPAEVKPAPGPVNPESDAPTEQMWKDEVHQGVKSPSDVGVPVPVEPGTTSKNSTGEKKKKKQPGKILRGHTTLTRPAHRVEPSVVKATDTYEQKQRKFLESVIDAAIACERPEFLGYQDIEGRNEYINSVREAVVAELFEKGPTLSKGSVDWKNRDLIRALAVGLRDYIEKVRKLP
jgi:hypothetical protein